MSSENNEKINNIRHSLAHIMAAAVKELYPEVKFGIGPAIEKGFYYDFDFVEVVNPKSEILNSKQIQNSNGQNQKQEFKLTPEDLPRIEEKMRHLLKQDIKFVRKEISHNEAKNTFVDQPYKLNLIKELYGGRSPVSSTGDRPPLAEAETVSVYESGAFTDLCAGPHVESTKEINPKAFGLQKIAGAYWRGDEKNKMLTRIYGLAFKTERELKEYRLMLEEAEKRDHRKIGAKLDLFSFHEEAPGMPFFHPKGAIIYQELEKFWREAQEEFNYQYVICPSMLEVDIWKQSGHWDHYKDDMFFINAGEKKPADNPADNQMGRQFALRPMDCPGAILVYNNSPKSYRDLPIRYAEPGLISRKEKSGQLGGLFRVQQFKQDDAHIFLTEEQVEEEIKNVVKLVDKIYKPFGLEYKAYLSTRPDDYMGELNLWKKAEAELLKILGELYGSDYGLKEKDGAFYGPKIDYQLKDCLGRTWQCATIQLDFQMPLKFNCKYIDSNGQERTPVMIHRTIMGSFERFMGILIEQTAGAFPLWLSPIQAWVIPIGAGHHQYAQEITKKLKTAGIRIETKTEAGTIGKKIREGEMQKIPYLLVVGDKEAAANSVAVRSKNKDLGVLTIENIIIKIKEEIAKKI